MLPSRKTITTALPYHGYWNMFTYTRGGRAAMVEQNDSRRKAMVGQMVGQNTIFKTKYSKMTEAQIQAECVKWFRLNYQQFARLLFKIDNEGKRSPARASIALAMGLVSGIPDMFLSVARFPHNGAYFEFKKPGEKLSKKQQEILPALALQGYAVYICDCLEQFQQALTQYFDTKY